MIICKFFLHWLHLARFLLPEYTFANNNQFNIVKDFGCPPATSNTFLFFVLVFSWPLIIAVVSACDGSKFSYVFHQFKDLRVNDSPTYVRY